MGSKYGSTLEIRFWNQVLFIPFHNCWEWRGPKNSAGYATMNSRGKTLRAHRFSYGLHHGKIPDGDVLDHLCRNRGCVRPEHLQAVSNAENVLRGDGVTAKNKRKLLCPSGHSYSGENLYQKPNGDRVCRTCKTSQQIARRKK